MRFIDALIAGFAFLFVSAGLTGWTQTKSNSSPSVLRGSAAFGDFKTDHPGVRRVITIADLPKPFATVSANNFARIIPRPKDAWPLVPAGFNVELVATGLENPR